MNDGLADFFNGDKKWKFALIVKVQESVILEWIVTGGAVEIGTLKMKERMVPDTRETILNNLKIMRGQMLNVVFAANAQRALNHGLLTCS